MDLTTSDGYATYRGAILEAYGATVTVQTRRMRRAVEVERRIVFGAAQAVGAVLARSESCRARNPAFVERQNGADWSRNARKVRKSYWLSKEWSVHHSITYFTMDSDKFFWPVRTLRISQRSEQGRVGRRRWRWLRDSPIISGHSWTG
jgi:hypothetical protein